MPPRWVARLVAAAVAVSAALAAAFGPPLFGGPPDFPAACALGEPWYVATCYRAQTQTGSRPQLDAPSIVLFKDTPDNGPHYALATFAQTGAVWGLAYSERERAVYAGAFHKRSAGYRAQSAGGTVYRIDLGTGEVAPLYSVPGAYGSYHRGPSLPNGTLDHDLWGARWVGSRALGDIEISDDQTELFVMNLPDGRIHRLALPRGSRSPASTWARRPRRGRRAADPSVWRSRAGSSTTASSSRPPPTRPTCTARARTAPRWPRWRRFA